MYYTDKDIEMLLVEALDYNSHIVTLCTGYFGNMSEKRNREDFIKEYDRLTNDSQERRNNILRIKNDTSTETTENNN